MHLRLAGPNNAERCPLNVHSDNGIEFTVRVFTALADKLEIGLTHPPPYNLQSNRVERFHQKLNTGMRLFLDRNNNQWEPQLPAITMAYNTKVCKSTGVMPFLAYFRREAKLPADMVLRLPDTEYASVPANVQAIIERYQAVFEAIQQKEEGTIRRNAAPTREQPSTKWATWCGTSPPGRYLGSLGKSPMDGRAPGRSPAKLQTSTTTSHWSPP